jgi:hypothetical protein
MMDELHKSQTEDIRAFVPEEGQRRFLCSNKQSSRCPSSGIVEAPFGGSITLEIARKLLNDYVSTDFQIISRINYLRAFMRPIIQKSLLAHRKEFVNKVKMSNYEKVCKKSIRKI